MAGNEPEFVLTSTPILPSMSNLDEMLVRITVVEGQTLVLVCHITPEWPWPGKTVLAMPPETALLLRGSLPPLVPLGVEVP